MASLTQAKTLGGVGSILILLSAVPSFGPILSLAGFILVLIAVKYISDAVGDRSIFNNMLISSILAIIGLSVGFVIFFATFFQAIPLGRFDGMPGPPAFLGPEILTIIISALLGLAIIWVFFIASAIFLRRSFNSISVQLNVGMFSTAALLYLIGSLLLIILVGFLILFVAGIFQAVAFFSMPEEKPQPRVPPAQLKLA